jgi:putative membrane protein
MTLLAQLLIIAIAGLHIYILILEMFLWDKPAGMRAFGHSLEKAKITKVYAQNQGLYNGFLAAGLIWSLCLSMPFALDVANFFLSCVAVAGIYGGLTAHKKIIFIQSLPAIVGLGLVNLI